MLESRVLPGEWLLGALAGPFLTEVSANETEYDISRTSADRLVARQPALMIDAAAAGHAPPDADQRPPVDSDPVPGQGEQQQTDTTAELALVSPRRRLPAALRAPVTPKSASGPALVSGLVTGALVTRTLPAAPAARSLDATAVDVTGLARPAGEDSPTRGMTGSDSGNSIALDGLGNSYITGSYWNGADTDIFVSKVTPSGTVLFTTVLPNPGTDSGNAIALDDRGNAYVAGARTNSRGDTDAFLAKFSRGGALIQMSTINNPGHDAAHGVAVGNGNKGYMTGALWNGTDSDFFLTRFTATTDFACSFVFPNPGADAGHAVAVDAAFNAYVTGTFHFVGDNYLYLAKFESSCSLLNGTYIFNAGMNAGNGIAVNAAGEGFVTGQHWNGTDSDFILARFDAAGAFPDSFIFPNPGTDSGNAVVFDSGFNAHVTGAFTFAADVYVYTAIFDPTCALLDGGYIFHVGQDRGTDIALHASGNSFVTGAWDRGRHTDAFVAQFDPALDVVNQTFIPNSN
jgi:hypothetical protein